jgi:hypothetical protein
MREKKELKGNLIWLICSRWMSGRSSNNTECSINEKGKGGKSPERDYRKEIIEAEYYNYNRIPGYNHHTGWVDKRYPRSRDERVTEPLDVKLIIFDE